MTQRIAVVGIDVGHGQVKVVGPNEAHHDFPSVIVELAGQTWGSKVDPTLMEGNRSYLIGDAAISQARVNEVRVDSNYTESDAYRRFMKHALAALQLRDQGFTHVYLVTGLPVQFFEDQRAALSKRIHGWNEMPLPITGVTVIPQPMGTLYDLILDADGRPASTEFGNDEMAIIDVGDGTMDGIGVKGNKPLLDSGIGKPEGVSRVVDIVRNYIVGRLGVRVTQQEARAAMQKGSVLCAGNEKSLEAITKQAKQQLRDSMMAMVSDGWDGGKRLRHIIVTGGGASFLGEELTRSLGARQLIVPTDPSMANARGFFKVGMAQSVRSVA